ncbi:uncharacterized protein METZ01_LOCUS360698, partial [marine metagenome]
MPLGYTAHIINSMSLAIPMHLFAYEVAVHRGS